MSLLHTSFEEVDALHGHTRLEEPVISGVVVASVVRVVTISQSVLPVLPPPSVLVPVLTPPSVPVPVSIPTPVPVSSKPLLHFHPLLSQSQTHFHAPLSKLLAHVHPLLSHRPPERRASFPPLTPLPPILVVLLAPLLALLLTPLLVSSVVIGVGW